MLWTKARSPLTREELDAKRSGESEERDSQLNAYNGIAEIFNNRFVFALSNYRFIFYSDAADFQPQNEAIKYQDGKPLRSPASSRISQAVMEVLYDIDPNERQRPVRDGLWVKTQMRLLTAQLSIKWTNLNRSGSQNGDVSCTAGIDEWVLVRYIYFVCKFCTTVLVFTPCWLCSSRISRLQRDKRVCMLCLSWTQER